MPRLDTATGHAAWCTPQLVALVDAALDKDPGSRFPSASVMIAALDDAFLSLDSVT